MPRPTRKEINFTKESILSLMQEIYNELVEQRQTAIRIQNKMLAMLKSPEDMQSIGPVIEKQQKIVNDCVEKKISLSKLQSGIWEKSNTNTESFTLSDLDDDMIQNLIEKDVSKDETLILALTRPIEIIGEAANGISQPLRDAHPLPVPPGLYHQVGQG